MGYAICGSFCTFRKSVETLKTLIDIGYEITPIMSFNSYETDTRFGAAKDFINEIEALCEKKIIHTIVDAEPIGPRKMFDIMVVAPCTGNTLAKLANSIVDTPVIFKILFIDYIIFGFIFKFVIYIYNINISIFFLQSSL